MFIAGLSAIYGRRVEPPGVALDAFPGPDGFPGGFVPDDASRETNIFLADGTVSAFQVEIDNRRLFFVERLLGGLNEDEGGA